jgi:isopenicillin-N epimerase
MPSVHAEHWTLDPDITFLNHGSFGACPKPVLEAQARFRLELEREPVRFYMREVEPLVDAVRIELAQFLGADPLGLVFVNNATSGVNAVIRSLELAPGDELLVTNQSYNACKNAFIYAAERAGAKVVSAELPFPIASPDDAVEALLAKVGPKTKLALLDHVTSPTGVVMPIEAMVKELAAKGVESLVDGAHAPGMIALDLAKLGAAYYTGNLHKWVCAPKSVAFLYVREDKRESVRPTVISHGANSPREGRSRLWVEFDWIGTQDPTPILAVPAALRFLPTLAGGTWAGVYESNRNKALAARKRLCEALGVEAPAPDSMIGSLAAVPLPGVADGAAGSTFVLDPLQTALFDRYSIEVPIVPWGWPRRMVRISAQLYNDASDYEKLIAALQELLPLARR